MSSIKINISKTSSNTKLNKESIDERENQIIDIFKDLMSDKSIDEENVFNKILDYIKKYDRVLYSPISSIIYDCYNSKGSEEATKAIDLIMNNIQSLLDYCNSEKYEIRIAEKKEELNNKNTITAVRKTIQESIKQYEDTKKVVLKIWDHVNLAQLQYSTLKQSDEDYKQKFDNMIDPFKEELTKDISSQLLTMVSIFTALSFLVFGGISSLDNIFSSHGVPLIKLVCIGSVWGLCILNLVFVFLFCVGKMTKLNLYTSDESNENIFQKYAIVWWTDIVILAVILLSGWIYYVRISGFDSWVTAIFLSNQKAATIIGTTIICLIIILAIVFLICQSRNNRTRKR